MRDSKGFETRNNLAHVIRKREPLQAWGYIRLDFLCFVVGIIGEKDSGLALKRFLESSKVSHPLTSAGIFYALPMAMGYAKGRKLPCIDRGCIPLEPHAGSWLRRVVGESWQWAIYQLQDCRWAGQRCFRHLTPNYSSNGRQQLGEAYARADFPLQRSQANGVLASQAVIQERCGDYPKAPLGGI